MNIIQNLPDDIILHIYTKCLKRYRFYDGKLIKLIDIDKYKFLEKYIDRRLKVFYKLNSSNDGEIKYRIQYQLSNLIDINRKDSHIDDDMICIELTINDSSIRYDVVYNRGKSINSYKGNKYNVVYSLNKTLKTNNIKLSPGIGIKKAIIFSISPKLEFKTIYSL
jgi:hypothetical protein